MLSIPINVFVLQTLADGSTSLTDLRRAAGSPPQTTMRSYLNGLSESGVLVRRRRTSFPGSLDFDLTPAGQDLLNVTASLQSWLAEAPEGPIEIGSVAAQSAIKALVEGWSPSLLRALAARPLSLTELNRLVPNISYPALERRLAAMRLAGQIEAQEQQRRGRPYGVTPWLRLAVGPVLAAVRWEHSHAAPEAAPLGRLDVETAFLLSIPALRLPADLSGFCRLAVRFSAAGGSRLAGVLIHVENGTVAACASRLRGNATAWASGSVSAWLTTLVEGSSGQLEIGGDSHLATAVLEALHASLFRRDVASA